MLEIFKDFFACKIVLAAKRQYPGNIRRFFACKIVLAAKHQYLGKIQRLFRLQAVSQPQPAIIQQPVATISNQQ